MESVLQSKRVRRCGHDIQVLELATGDGNKSEPAEEDERNNSYPNYTVFPAHRNNVTASCGMYSSRVARRDRKGSQRQKQAPYPVTADSQITYNIFEDPLDCFSLKKLPHPRELFGKRGCNSAKKKKQEQINSVENHVVQCRSKRAQMMAEIEKYRETREHHYNPDKTANIYTNMEHVQDISGLPQLPEYTPYRYHGKANMPETNSQVHHEASDLHHYPDITPYQNNTYLSELNRYHPEVSDHHLPEVTPYQNKTYVSEPDMFYNDISDISQRPELRTYKDKTYISEPSMYHKDISHVQHKPELGTYQDKTYMSEPSMLHQEISHLHQQPEFRAYPYHAKTYIPETSRRSHPHLHLHPPRSTEE